MKPGTWTLFGETEAWLGNELRRADLDHEAFQRPLSRCEPARCGGTCCHDGVHLNPDEVPALQTLLHDHARTFAAMELSLPANPIVEGPKTATRPDPRRTRLEHYPAHFPETSCVFLDREDRCAFQRLAIDHRRHPWYYKPLTCWMHPVSLQNRKGQAPLLTLFDEATDPQRKTGYPGFVPFTPCGQTCASGQPAWQVLKPELDYLGRIAGRRLLEELETG